MKKASNLCSRKFWYIPKFQADQFQQMTGCAAENRSAAQPSDFYSDIVMVDD